MLFNIASLRRGFLDRLADPRRDIDDECGFPKVISLTHYQDVYDREPIAARLVEFASSECWQVSFKVYESEDEEELTPFEEDVANLLSSFNGEPSYYKDEEGSLLQSHLYNLDVISGIQSYGVMLIGFDDGLPLSRPVEGVVETNTIDQKAKFNVEKSRYDFEPVVNGEQEPYQLTTNAKGVKVTFLREFTEKQARIVSFEANRSSPRYGLPTMYHIMFDDFAYGSEHESMGVTFRGENVHWTRVLHVPSDGGHSSHPVFGISRLQPSFNDILGVRKLAGGSPEGYWKMCFTSLVFESLPQLGANPKINKAAIRQEIEKFQNGLQKFMLATGLTAKSIAPSVLDPTPHHNMLIERICIKGGWPIRLFKGSERGDLASSQDSRNWEARVRLRQNRRCTARIIVPFYDRLILVGAVRPPKEKYMVYWPDMSTMTDQEKAALAATRQGAIASFVDKGNTVMTAIDFWTKEMGYKVEEAQAIIDNIEEMQEEADRAQELLDQMPPDEQEQELPLADEDEDEEAEEE